MSEVKEIQQNITEVSTIRYNFSELFSVAFGIGTKFFPVKYNHPTEQSEGVGNIHFDIPSIDNKEEAIELTKLGTPILFPITFIGKGYNKYDRNGKIINVELKDFRLPASSLIEISRDKAETTTPLSGITGSVKEIYGFEDWKITIKGICFNEQNHPTHKTPIEQKNELYQWESLADSIKIESEILRDFDIYNLFIKNIQFGQIAGKPEFLPFQIECLSDEPIELFNL